MSTVNTISAPSFGFLNDSRIADLEAVLSSDFVKNADLNTKVGESNYIKIGAVNSALESYYTKSESDDKYAVIADIPSVTGFLTATDIAGKQDSGESLNTAVGNFGYLKQSGVLGAVETDGYLKQAAVLSAVQTAGYIKADNAAITEKVSLTGLQTAVDNLSRYAIGSEVATALDAKTSKTYVDDALALKQSISGMSAYAIGADMAEALDAKASASRVNAIKAALETLLTTLITGSSGALATAYTTAKTSIEAS